MSSPKLVFAAQLALTEAWEKVRDRLERWCQSPWGWAGTAGTAGTGVVPEVRAAFGCSWALIKMSWSVTLLRAGNRSRT